MNKIMPLSDKDILNNINTRILTYTDLQKYNDLDDVLINNSLILMYECKKRKNSISNGHWVLILKRKNTYEYFDSFGLLPDKALLILKNKNKIKLTKLLKNKLINNYKIDYNNIKLQSIKAETCGYYCCCRVILQHLSFKQFLNILNKQYGDNYDDKIIKLYNKFFNM